MKQILVIFIKACALSLIVPCFVHANPTGMSEAQMQQMMKQAEAALACMNKVDQSKLEALEAESLKMKSKVKALCKAGKRDEATQTAINYSKNVNADPTLNAMTQCGQMMQGMMPKAYSPINDDPASKSDHVCDSMK